MRQNTLLWLILALLVFFSPSIQATDFFWVNGSGNWTDFTNHWATTSGGTTFHDSVPGPADRVFFDANSFSANGQTVAVDTSLAECLSIDFTGSGFSPTFTGTTGDTLNVRDDFILINALNWSYSGLLLFSNGADTDSTIAQNDTADIYLNGQFLPNDCVFNGQGLWEMQDNFKTSGEVLFQQGSLNFLADSLLAGAFRVEDPIDTTVGSNVSFFLQRNLDFGNASILIADAGSSWQVEGDATSITANLASLIFTYAGTDSLFFRSDSANGSLGSVFLPPTIVLIEKGADIAALNLASGTALRLVPDVGLPLVVGAIFGNGNCGNFITIESSLQGTQAYMRATTAASVLSFVRVRDLNLAGSNINLTQSLDDGKLSGPWVISGPTSSSIYYWINDSGNWTDPTHWATTSGGTSNGCIPGPMDNVIFDANSFSIPNQTVNLDRNAFCADMDWSGMDELASLIGDADKMDISGSLTLSSLLTISFDGNVSFTGSGSISSAQTRIPGPVFFLGTAYTLSDSLISDQSIFQESGSLTSNGRYIEAAAFIRGSGGGNLNLSNAEVLLTGSDTVWQSLGATLGNINVNGADFRLTDPSQLGVMFEGDSLDYGSLILENSYTELLGSNRFGLLQVEAGSTLAIENEKTQTVDSLIATGSCDAPVFLQSVSPGSDPAIIEKQGFAAVSVDNVYITQLIADTTGGFSYTATNSVGFNNTDGWTITGAIGGTDFYWVGNTGNWSDPSNWSLTSGGVSGTCLPGIGDNVIFDGNSFASANDTVFGDVTAYFQNMDWSGITQTPTFFQIRDLYPGGNVTLSTNLTWEKLGLAAQVTFRPNSGKSIFDTQGISLNTSIQLLAENNTDTLELAGNLLLDTVASIVITRGTFLTNNFDMRAGTFFLATLEPKDISLGSSQIEVFFSWFILDVISGLTFDAGTSEIFVGGFKSQTFFYGNGETYNDVTILPTEGSNTLFFAENTFENLTFAAGADVVLPFGDTQQVNGDFNALGTCEDSISISSSLSFSNTIIDVSNTSSVSGECLNVERLTLNQGGAAGSFTVFFSTDQGSNNGLIFSGTPATTASFTGPASICLEDSVFFTSTSTSVSGNVADLSFVWDFGDGDSSTVANPAKKYSDGGEYPITLVSTFTNGCFDTFKDTLDVREPTIDLATSEPDFSFCEGTEVELRIPDTTLTDYTFYVNGNVISTGTANEISTTAIQDGDEVYATATVLGCLATSDTLTFTVIPGPDIQIFYLGASNTVCTGDSLLFAATGGTLYEWFIDTVSQNFPSTDTSFLTTSLLNGQVVKVQGQDIGTGCSAFSDDSVVLNVLPLPNLLLVSDDFDQIICDGDLVNFTATGATTYEFFVDGVSQGSPTTTNTFSSTTLQNNGVVSVAGTLQGCTSEISAFPFTVNPTPNTLLTSSDPDTTICEGDLVTFTASGATAYQFVVNGVPQGSISGNNGFSSSSLNDGDVVQVVGFLGSCGDTSGAFTFRVQDLPVVGLLTASTDTICEGEVVVFTANGANEYQFFLDGNAIGPFSTTNTLSLNNLQSAQTISVQGRTNGCADFASQTYSFFVKPTPVVSLFKVSTGSTFCEGEDVTFAGVGAGEYEFFVNGVSQGAPSTNSQITLSNLPVGNPQVTLQGYTNACVGISSDTFNIQVLPLPVVSLSSNSTGQALCQGDTVTVYASGAGSYQFLVDGIAQGPSTLVDTLLLPNLQNSQTITAVGKLNGCSDTSANSLSFTVDPLPVVSLSVSDPDLNICEGENVVFSSSGATTYEFFLDGISLGPPSTTSTFSSSSLQNQQVVTVIGTSGNCSAPAPNSLALTVNPIPQVDLVSSDPDTSICEGDMVTFTASGASTYEFLIDGQSQGAPSLSSQFSTSNLTNGQQIQVIGYSNQNCPDSSSILTFVVLPSPGVGLTSDNNNGRLCEGDLIIFTANGASTYEFFINGVSVQGPGPLATYATDSLQANQTVSVVGSLGVCPANGDSTYQFTVDARPNPRLALQGDAEICVGESITVNASGAPEFEFFINGISQGVPSSNGTFTTSAIGNGQEISVVGVNNDCRVDGDSSYIITVNNFPAQVGLVSSDPDLNVCFQDALQITASGAAIYQFFLNGNSLASPDSSNILNITELEDGDVIRVRGAFGDCFTSSADSLTFQVTKLDLSLTSNPGNLLCEGDPVSIDANGADLYEFFVNGSSQGSASSNSTLLPSSLSDGSRVTFTGTDNASGCVQTAEDEIIFRVIPAANVAPQGPFSFCEGEELILRTTASENIQWYKDGVEIFGENADSLFVLESGMYSVATEQGGQDEVWSVGKNAQGQLGDSTQLDRLELRQVFENEMLRDVDGGRDFSLARTLDGRVYAWGDNSFGQLGDGTFIDRPLPFEVPTLSGARFVEGGELHSLVLLSNGKVFAFGDNRAGQLGLGNNSVSSFPFEITALAGIQRIAAGAKHSLAMNTNGQLYAWGDNGDGQLGDGTNINQNLPQLISSLPALQSMAAGQSHSLALTTNGEVYAWGSNARGQLGLDSLSFSFVPLLLNLPERIVEIAAGDVHSIFLGESGRVYVSGGNDQGQLGLGDQMDRFVPVNLIELPLAAHVFATSFQSFGQLNDNSIYGWGRNVSGSLGNEDTVDLWVPTYLPKLTGAEKIAGGWDHLLVLMGFGVACESQDVEVEVKAAPEVSIVQSFQDLEADQTGVSYQWFVNGNALLNDTSKQISPLVGGDYTVEVTYANGCKRLSDPFNFIPVNIEEELEKLISIYPNPAKEYLHIEIEEGMKTPKLIEMYGGRGEKLIEMDVPKGEALVKVYVGSFSRGIYSLRVMFESGLSMSKKIEIN